MNNYLKTPTAVKWLLILNIIAYILELFNGIDKTSYYCGLFYVGSPFFHPYQLITYMFMHGSTTHIFFNMFALWMFGRSLEMVWGWRKFLLYYMICGLGAGIIQEIGQAMGIIHIGAMTIGASGAVFGILLAFAAVFPDERLFVFPFPVPIKSKYYIMIYAAIELFAGVESNDGVAHYAHLGGMLFGLITLWIWKMKKKKKKQYSGWNYNKSEKRGGWTVTVNSMTPNEYTTSTSYTREEGEEIDRILDKVRQRGYANLTREEKERLFNASKK